MAEARECAQELRRQVQRGEDPIKAKRLAREQAKDGLLESVALAALEAHRGGLKQTDGKQWFLPFRLHILPKLGKMPVTKIDQHDINAALKPIWKQKNETARKALSRLKIVFRHAVAFGYEVDLVAIENARVMLGQVHHVTTSIKSVPWQKVPEFYRSLDDHTPTHLALRMLILTGVRSDAVRHMRLENIWDSTWTVPKENMKARVRYLTEFDVPLSDEALRVVELARPHARNGYLFPNSKGIALSKMAMREEMLERGMEERPHGFRSSLRTWLSDQTDCDRQIAEACIQHIDMSEVEKIYNRTEFTEKRRPYMQAWSTHVTSSKGRIRNAA